MSEPLYQRCPMCHGTLRLPADTRICDYPPELAGACLCTRSRMPGWAEVGVTAGQLEKIAAERDKLQAFKNWTHQYLDAHGVPHHPPGTHGAEGCRIGDRMDWLMAERYRLRAALEGLLHGLDANNDPKQCGLSPARWHANIATARAALASVYSADDFPCLSEEDHDEVAAECCANARLIAAAPELLAACEAIVAADGSADLESWGQMVGEAMRLAHLAAGKATGKPE